MLADTLARVVEALLPIVLLVVAGASLRATGFLDEPVRNGTDRLIYWVCLPALIVAKVSEAGALAVDAWTAAGVAIVASTAAFITAGLVGWLSRVDARAMGVLVQAGCRGNIAFVGLPVVVLATDDTATKQLAALALAPLVIYFNVVAVSALVIGAHAADAAATGEPDAPRVPFSLAQLLRRVIRSILTNPLLIACAAGVAIAATGVRLPGPVGTTLSLLGQPAAPLALLSLGAALVIYPVRGHLRLAGVTALVKVAVTPAVAWWVASALGIPPEPRQVAMIFAACPTAVASYVLVTQLGGDRGLAASCIVLSTVASALSLAAALALT